MSSDISKNTLNGFAQLKDYKKSKRFLVALDTDGCVVDNMSGKQILVFHPLFMEFYNLWKIESYFRETAEYVSLFSHHRGSNRFIAISLTLRGLRDRRDVMNLVKEENLEIPDTEIIEDFIDFCKKNQMGLSNSSLQKFLETRLLDFGLHKLLGWSSAVNEVLLFINRRFEPFYNVRKCLEMIYKEADIVVVSQTPYDDLFEYYVAHDMIKYIRFICSQEIGSKSYQIEMLKKIGGYSESDVLVVGDSYGDFEAARINNVNFYPVIPAKEEKSWIDFPEIFNLFLAGKYNYEKHPKIEEFLNSLPSLPEWEKTGYNHKLSYRKHQDLRKNLYQRFNPDGRLLLL